MSSFDIEGRQQQQQQRQRQQQAPSNPYSNPPPNILPARHPLNIIKRCGIMTACAYSLHRLDVYDVVMNSPKVNHDWFRIGLAITVAGFFLKAYLEMYEGKLRQQEVNYKNYPQTTHAMLVIILVSSISFHAALWPAFGGGRTILIVDILVGFGILLQFALLVPTYIQNVVGFIALTFFLQEYSA